MMKRQLLLLCLIPSLLSAAAADNAGDLQSKIASYRAIGACLTEVGASFVPVFSAADTQNYWNKIQPHLPASIKPPVVLNMADEKVDQQAKNRYLANVVFNLKRLAMIVKSHDEVTEAINNGKSTATVEQLLKRTDQDLQRMEENIPQIRLQ